MPGQVLAVVPAWVYKLLGLIALSSALWLHGCHQGRQAMRQKVAAVQTKLSTKTAEFEAFKHDVETKGNAQKAIVDRSIAQSEAYSRESAKTYQTELDRVRTYYAERVRRAEHARSNPGAVPAVPAPPVRVDVAASDPGFVGRCAQTTQQLVSLQEWVNEQERIMNARKN